jgi:hypothetical protein
MVIIECRRTFCRETIIKWGSSILLNDALYTRRRLLYVRLAHDVERHSSTISGSAGDAAYTSAVSMSWLT